MYLKLLWHGERIGDMHVSRALSEQDFALLWIFQIEGQPSIAVGFLAGRDQTIELSQPLILDVEGKLLSERPYRDRLHFHHGWLNLDAPGIHIHSRIEGWDWDWDWEGLEIGLSMYEWTQDQTLYGHIYEHGRRQDTRIEGHVEFNKTDLRIDVEEEQYINDPPRMRGWFRFSQGLLADIHISDWEFLFVFHSLLCSRLEHSSRRHIEVKLHPLLLTLDSETLKDISSLYASARTRYLEALLAPMRRDIPYTLVRYPSLETPTRLFVGKPFMLTVGLGQWPHEGTSGLVVLENLPPDQESFLVEFEVLSEHFSFPSDNNRGVLKITHDDRKAYAQLELTPLSIEGEYQLSDLVVVFFFEGKRCGTAHHSLLVLANETIPEATLPKIEQTTKSEVPLKGAFGAKVPELVLELFKSSSDDSSFDCHVRSAHLVNFPRRFLHGKINLGLNTAFYMNNLYKKIAQQQSGGISASNCISAIGDILYDIAPDCFKRAYWQLHDELGDKFQTIQIYSDEPWIPWELMRPVRTKDDGTVEGHSFLGVEHSVGRWLNLQAGEPPQSIQAAKVTVVVPNYVHSPLPYARQEADWLIQHISAIELKPAIKDKIVDFLQNGETHILHFSCHGKASEDANVGEILLEDGALSAFELKSREIRYGSLVKNHPLVFINACESGRTGLTLEGLGGLASALVDLSCSAVIGSLWTVDDKDAFEVVRLFYERLLEADKPLVVADVMREIRKKFLDGKRDTFLAYTFFGDPNATISLQRSLVASARRGSAD